MEITARTLNRTYLSRQLLLTPPPADTAPSLDGNAAPARGAADVVRHLVAVQAQEVDAPYVGLWARIPGFTHDDLTEALESRQIVRGGLLRGTQHLSAAADYRWLRPLIRAGLGEAGLSAFRRDIRGLDLAAVAARSREILAGRTMTRPQLAKALAPHFPQYKGIVLGWIAQHQLNLVHPPPSGVWRRRGHVHIALAEDWLGGDLAEEPKIEELIRRYLQSCGPATVPDIQVWSGLRRLREPLEAMRPSLRVYRDEAGRELFDLPEAELADPETPAPVRFLPDFDNLVLSHDDRSRIIRTAADRAVVCPGYSIVRPTFLVDGYVAGTWSADKERLRIEPFARLTDAAAVHAEAQRLRAFLQLPADTPIDL